MIVAGLAVLLVGCLLVIASGGDKLPPAQQTRTLVVGAALFAIGLALMVRDYR